MWLYQKWYYNQSWGNGSDAAFLLSPETTESIPAADVLAGDEPFDLLVDRFLGQSVDFRIFLSPFPDEVLVQFTSTLPFSLNSLSGFELYVLFTVSQFLLIAPKLRWWLVHLRSQVIDGKTEFLPSESSH